MKNVFPPYLRVSVVFLIVVGGLEYFIDSGDQFAFVKYPIIILLLVVFLVLLIAIEMTYAALNNVLWQIMTEEQRAKQELENAQSIRQQLWFQNLMKALTKSEPLETETSLLLAHDYDGIKELDNNLPPWWIYLFYSCIAFAAIYMIRFEVLGADDQEAEFRQEMAQAKIDVATYKLTAPDLMDEDKVILLTDAADLAKGKEIFQTNCIACHRADAGGQIGPNLTDKNWILGGGIKNIFHTVTEGGRDGKGMVAWGGTLKPTQIQLVASYVISLQGSNPKDPKAPDGEEWIDVAEKITQR